MRPSIHSLAGTDLSCIRDDRVLFEQLAFELVAGQVLLLEGKNGSGKTSLLRILCGFREPDAGALHWCGDAVKDSQFYAQMAYVGHLDGIKKELTVLENLKMSLALSSVGHYSIDQALNKVHLTGYDDILVQALSAGQKRRLSLARLLITENVLWILDEPFTSLDKQGIALIETLMAEHCANGGMIVLTSHHDIDLPGVDVQRINLS
ncbi:MAG: cytochrome c biogenesis heme-transporting ATPase CcmA [Methylobacter sp.]|nr:cytochrome c biogenesis heme-transporting ATPase CcmA [Methylobacter sp.]MDP2097441.1 cytochrome c biogenesis heme-transporting ATPase CcmA [Methylobacter sp.]MDP2428637.1 cytochrome c biogenesis heme-transporting ATPase CcmA [Methylobacter sp.]MDP3056473.1 cytochrome c biogenesis heme-transporting ATPase CcmA [Methylobacter sp.]MDP3363219.1 cytochrome c biogenesis heme-transporting ATPase CcmA [Methylobacter sp.]